MGSNPTLSALTFRNLRLVFFLFIFVNIILCSWWALHNDLLFHTDIARDFLVLEQIVKTHKPTLIGPKAGGISGVYHGPLWFYLNLPAFILGKGDPVVVAWFWVFLSVISIGITYLVGKKLFDEKIALFASLLFSVFAISYTKGLTNPFGAVLFFPVFFYLFKKYISSLNISYLISALFCIGLIIQFEVAFGLPILILSTIYLIPFLIKKKKILHFLSYFVLVIPLSTYFVFELRHNFLQSRAVVEFLTTKQKVGELPLLAIVFTRIRGVLFDGLGLIPKNSFFTLPVTLLFGYIILRWKDKKIKYKENYFLYFYFYMGFWVIAFFFKGVLQSYYYWPFLPITLLVFSSTIDNIDRRIFYALFIFILVFNFYFGLQSLKREGPDWRFYQKVAQDMYKDSSKKEFGYFVYTPDLLGYAEKYSMMYSQRDFPESKVFPYQKKESIYLLIAPAPNDKPYLNGNWWRTHQVKIQNKPVQIFQYAGNYTVEKYVLTKEEIKIPPDPNLVQDLTFR